MRENNLITKSLRKASSLARYSIRIKKDTCLHDDVEDFLFRRQPSISHLVDKLLNDDFALARRTDPTYPV
jgi:hypothetical protein